MLVLAIISVTALTFIDKSKWDIKYETVTLKSVQYKEVCYMDRLQVNGTIHKAGCVKEFEKYIYVETPTKKIIGISDGKETIKNAYKEGNTVSVWTVPIGDRNFEEYGKCRQYEKEKGVCYEK